MTGKKKAARRASPGVRRPAARSSRRAPATDGSPSSPEGRLAEALAQQAATSEILRVIAGSRTDVRPVFDSVARAAARLLGAIDVSIFTREGDQLRLAAHEGSTAAGPVGEFTVPIVRGTVGGRSVLEGRAIQVADLAAEAAEYPEGAPNAHRFGFRTILSVPLLHDGVAVGCLQLRRAERAPFTERQVALLETFADQAVIAIENVRLFKELEARNEDLAESLEQQTATGEILRVISRSPTDVQPVFETIVRSARELCGADSTAVFSFDGALVHVQALDNANPERSAALRAAYPMPATHGHATGRAILTGEPVHIHDIRDDPDYALDTLRDAVSLRTLLSVPMIRDGSAIGAITLQRWVTARPFSDAQVRLLQTFADQAVIAVENVRLFQELGARNRDLTVALDQQTATSEILRVISQSHTDVQPVFEAIVRSAAVLCRGIYSALFRFDGEWIHQAAQQNFSAASLEEVRRLYPARPSRAHGSARAILERAVVHIPDVTRDPEYLHQSLSRAVGFRSGLFVPMLRDGEPIGAIMVARAEAGPFEDGAIELLKTFADQAVIAVENARLFQELEIRNRDLTETLEQQTATSEILRVISSSPTDIQPAFDAVARSALRLCRGEFAWVFRFDGQLLHVVAHDGLSPGALDTLRRTFPRAADRGTAAGRSMQTRAVEHIPDVHRDPDFAVGATATEMNFRSVVAVPILRDDRPVGAIAVARSQEGLFPDRQVALLQTFADQAVIAIENVRLFKELEARNRDLTNTLEQQTATSEILRVISSSPTDVQPVFDSIARSARRLLEAEFCFVFQYDGESIHFCAHDGLEPEGVVAMNSIWPSTPNRGFGAGRAILDRRVVHIPDVRADAEYRATAVAAAARFSNVLAVPMLREGLPIGAITVNRRQPGAFSERQIELLKTFAEQAVIAVENVRLFKELEARNRDLTETLEQQTATGEILRVISSSPTDVQPVFDTIAQSARRLCDGQFCLLYRYDGSLLHFVAHDGLTAAGLDAVRRAYPMAPGRGSAAARAVLTGQVAHIADVSADPDYAQGRVAQAIGSRSILAVPMLREGVPVGTIVVARVEAGPFPDRLLDLLKTFADQAVIAVENVRLFKELEARTGELSRSVDELRALGEVSQAVSSTLDLEAVLATIVSRAVELSGSQSGIVYEFDEATQVFHARATHHITEAYLEVLREAPIRLGEGAMGTAAMVQKPVQVADIQDERQLVAPQARAHLIRQGLRSLLAMPLTREGRLLGGLVILRREAGMFEPEVVATMRTFATQSVLALQNARLFVEIQRQKQYSEVLVQSSPVAIATMDLHGVVVGWNPGAERLFGYPQAEAVGRRMEDLVATPETRAAVRANIEQTLAGESIHDIARRVRKDGSAVDVEIASVPVIVEGARVGMVGIYHDITELLRAREEAEAANEAKSAFLATMSHEIRTPMNAVIGMSGLLLNTRLNDEQREYAEIVRQSGDALLTVINDILDFSKIEAGRLELESQPFDLRECVESALDLVATRAAEKGLDLAYVLGDGVPPAIQGDVTRLRQVLLNLLSNAVKFTERGEVVLAVSARRGADADDRHDVTFSVRDTGIGIPADRLDRLFQSFSQVDASTTRRYGGTGLGLAISQRLTELMGSRITVTSAVGAGSEFRFTLRAAAATVPLPIRRDLTGVQPALQGKRVLVVDDNATNRRILASHLEAWGMRARATESPREALGWVRSGERFHLGILDMHMPEMDGIALARGIREATGAAALPLILFTSLGRREARADEEGFAAYLHKPIKPSQLFDALVSVLGDQPVHVPQRAAPRAELDPETAARHPLRILLAEDNVVNQKVALRLLGQMGYRADVASNGLEAVAAVERQPYDVVLMDVQMPELDGFEASREINSRWPDRRPRIVAMTANALEGDRELCEAAGMDDYVAKPIRVEELVAALGRARPRAGASARPGGAAEPAPAADAVDRAVVDQLAASMGREFVAELIDTFIADARELLAALGAALAASDRDGFRRAAHTLKSTGESLGAFGLAALARELEAMGQAGRLHEVGTRVDRLAALYERVVRALGEIRRDVTA